MNSWGKILGAALFVVICGLSPALAQDQGVVTVLALGKAPGGESKAASRDQAVASAVRRAVEGVALSMVDPATLRTQLALLEKEVLAQASSFVTTYTVESHSVDKEFALALVTVSVNKTALDLALNRAGLRLSTAKLASTLVMVAEESSPGRPPVFWWSGAPGVPPAPEAVVKVFTSLGATLPNRGSLAAMIPPEARQPVLEEREALDLAKAAGADLVILGRVRTYPLVTEKGENPPPVAQLLALSAETGQELATEEVLGPVFHASPGPGAGDEVSRAVEQAVRSLLEQVAGASPSQTQMDKPVSLKVAGLRSLEDLHRFFEVLESLQNIVAQVRWEAVGQGWTLLKVNLKGTTGQLADQLLLQDFGGFLVNVAETTPQRLELAIIAKNSP